MSKASRVGYIRVSALDQSTERQLDGIEALDKVFTDKVSGKDTNRPALQQALAYVREGDTLIVHSLDRLARNAEDLLRTVRELTGRGVAVEFVKNRMTFSPEAADPMGQLMLTMLAAFAEFERALIRERQREGIAIAKAKGVYTGRAKVLTADEGRELVEQARAGMPKADLARAYGVSRQTVYRYLASGA
jgi:DNA invertase Pin-like site-specific DNA recombinase